MKLLGKTFKCKMKTILLYMKKISNTVNHSNELMLTYFFRAVFINLYFKTKHSNETFHLVFYSLSNVLSYRKHISSKINISVLIISGKSTISPPPIFLLFLNFSKALAKNKHHILNTNHENFSLFSF